MRFIKFLLPLFFLFPLCLYGKLSNKELIPLIKEYNEAVKLGDPYAIGVAVKKLSKDDSIRVAKLILKVAVKFEDRKIHRDCLEAIQNIKSPKAFAYLLKNLESSPDWRVQILLMESLGNLRDKRVTTSLTKSLKSRYSPVLLTAIRILGRKMDRETLPALIELLKKRDKQKVAGEISYEIRVALNKITGRDYPTGEEWQKYWLTVGKNPSTSGSMGRTVVREIKRKGPRFFTETVLSERVVFIIDVSASMDEKDPYPPTEGRNTVLKKKPLQPAQLPPSRMRIERAKAQLIAVISKLSPQTKFNIIAFNNQIKCWSSSLKSASDSKKSSAIQFVSQFNAQGKTATHAAIKEALRNQGVDTFYLLSDGAPTLGPSASAILEYVYKENRFRKIRIHGLGFPGVDREFMMRLARENQGRYSDIR